MTVECLNEKETCFFSSQDIKRLAERPLPRHVAMIMDGNRRWGVKKFFLDGEASKKGHWAGAKILVDVVECALEMGIKVLTVFGFSTENWRRTEGEVDLLFQICEAYLKENTKKMAAQGVKFEVIGDLSKVPVSLRQTVQEAKNKTSAGRNMDFVIALNYGGRDELRRAIVKMGEDCVQKKLVPQDITEEVIRKYLDTNSWGDPDLLIRTGGEQRISNFLLWQLAYTELYVTEVLWPDFTPRDFLNAVVSFQTRQRRLGR